MIWLLLPLAFLLGALGRRVCGGVLNQWFKPDGGRVFGDLPTRIFFGVTIAAAALLGGWAIIPAAILIPAVWAGTTIGHYSSIDLGRGEGTYRRDFVVLTLHGVAGVLGSTIDAYWFSYVFWPLIIAGLVKAALYEEGYQFINRRRFSVRMPVGFRVGTEIGEALWGGAFGVAAFLTGVLG